MSGTGVISQARAGIRERATRWALLPLRIFLGVTFTYAAIDKFTTPGFFAGDGPNSIATTLHSIQGSAAIPAMITLALKNPSGFGYAIALGELAVGLGTLVGLFTRIAAFGGALISLSLWLTVSWTTSPYYYGNDLAYLMAWLPLVIGGAPQLSIDRFISRSRSRRRRVAQHASPEAQPTD
ncbi:MAG: DoxX family protein [Streptomycetaceae bacterium]|nr:DoxX family protein [Streptomycetaceae bacterium]